MKMKFFIFFSIFLVALTSESAANPHQACQRVYRRCNFRFNGHPFRVPTFSISGPADQAFTPRIVWKNRFRHIGIVNQNRVGSFISFRRGFTPTNVFPTGGQRFSRTQFKPYTIMRKVSGKKYLVGTPYSGIGHEVFQGNIRAAKGRCVLVRITSYQVLTRSKRVLRNINNQFECIVFWTK